MLCSSETKKDVLHTLSKMTMARSKIWMILDETRGAFHLVKNSENSGAGLFQVKYQLRKCKLKIVKFTDVCMTGGMHRLYDWGYNAYPQSYKRL